MLRSARTLALLAGLALVPGCGTSDDRAQARAVVERFYDAVREDRAGEACEQLSTATLLQLESQTDERCESVITRLSYDGGAVVATHVAITNAKVDLRTGESAFLSREPEGWRLAAVACRPEGLDPRGRPFDCEVES